MEGEGCSPEKNLNKHRYQWKKPDGEQFAQETHRLVLKIEGNLSRLRAKSAHFVAVVQFGDWWRSQKEGLDLIN